MLKVAELVEAAKGSLIAKGDISKINIKGISIDSREIKEGEAFVAIKGDNFDGHKFINLAVKKGASCIIAHKKIGLKIKVPLIQVEDTTLALGMLASFNREKYPVPVIAVTGSNGKSTTKEMIYAALSERFRVLKNEGTKNNHIGLPLTLLKLDGSYDAVVVEIGTNHFGEIEYLSKIAKANIGVITNIGPSHLESFKNLKGVLKEKSRLLCNLVSPSIAVLNADDAYLRELLFRNNCGVASFGVGILNKTDFRAYGINAYNGKYRYMVGAGLEIALNVSGYYNIYNSLMALAVGRIMGVDYPDIIQGISGFKLLRGRLNHITVNNLTFIDDTYNSNPLSLKEALSHLHGLNVKGRKIAVIGDMLELGNDKVKYHVQALKSALAVCDEVIAVGKISGLAVKSLKPRGAHLIKCSDAAKARKILLKDLKLLKGDLVLVKGSRGMKMEEVFKF